MSMCHSFTRYMLLSMVCSLGLVGCAGSPLREDPVTVVAHTLTGGLVGEQRIRQLEQEQRARDRAKLQRMQEEDRRAERAAHYLKDVQDLRKRENYVDAIGSAQHAVYLTPGNLTAWRTLLDLYVAVEPYPDVLKTTSDKIQEDTAMHYGRALLLRRRTGSGVSLDAQWNPIVSQWAQEAFDRRLSELIEERGKWLPSDREQAKQLINTLTGCLGPTDMFNLRLWMPYRTSFHEDSNYAANVERARKAENDEISRLVDEHKQRTLQCARQIGHEELYVRTMVERMFNLGLLLTAVEHAPTAATAVSIPSSKESTTP